MLACVANFRPSCTASAILEESVTVSLPTVAQQQASVGTAAPALAVAIWRKVSNLGEYCRAVNESLNTSPIADVNKCDA